MRDGCRLAIDLYLPERPTAARSRCPTILILTPYYRRFRLAPGATAEPSPNAGKYRDAFVPRGYAVVVVDTRGTGASFGMRDSFRSPREREDSREIADWIVAQPWSDGRIGATGHLLSRRRRRFPGQHRPPGREGDRAALLGLGHLCRQLLSGRHPADGADARL